MILGILVCISIAFDPLDADSIFALIVGIIAVICAAFGILAAWKRHTRFLLFYLVLCLIMIILDIITFIWVIFGELWGTLVSLLISICFWGAAFYFGYLLYRGEGK